MVGGFRTVSQFHRRRRQCALTTACLRCFPTPSAKLPNMTQSKVIGCREIRSSSGWMAQPKHSAGCFSTHDALGTHRRTAGAMTGEQVRFVKGVIVAQGLETREEASKRSCAAVFDTTFERRSDLASPSPRCERRRAQAMRAVHRAGGWERPWRLVGHSYGPSKAHTFKA